MKGKKVQRIVKEDKADKERPGPDNNVAIVATTKSIVGQFSGFAARIIPQDLIEKEGEASVFFLSFYRLTGLISFPLQFVSGSSGHNVI